MKPLKLVLGLILIVFPAIVSAEFYRFVEKDGTIHYTDDLTKIPENKISGLKRYKSDETDAKNGLPPIERIPDSSKKRRRETIEEIKKQKQIIQRKKALDEAFQVLMKEKAALAAERERLAKKPRWLRRRKTIELNKKIVKLNQKINMYEIKKNAFNDEIDVSKITIEKAQQIEKAVIRKSKGNVRY